MRGWLRQRRGQAAVETAITLPWAVVMVMGVVQLSMIQHARYMTEYAAYNAARSGAVWNADPKKMKTAAVMSLLPLYRRTTDVVELATSYVFVYAMTEATAAIDVPIIKVQTLSPTQQDFPGSPNENELDFDDPSQAAKNLLTVRVRVLYELKIPFANLFIFESWLAGLGGRQVRSGLYPYKKYSAGGALPVQEITARLAAEAAAAKWETETCARTGVSADLAIRLLPLAARAGKYFLPLSATYTMRMQSNPFKKHLPEEPKPCED